jgi:hypothetical protein
VTPHRGTAIDYWWFDEAKARALEQRRRTEAAAR